MRVGLVVDGFAEFSSMGHLFRQLESATDHQFVGLVHANIQPLASPAVIARECLKGVRALSARSVDHAVILFDRETRDDCCGELAATVEAVVAANASTKVSVVLKDRAFENWLVADLQALKAQRARFVLSRATERAVAPGKADHVDGYRLLQRSARGDYDKVEDAGRILQRADVLRIGSNSRSFRRFLHILGHPDYLNQSSVPH